MRVTMKTLYAGPNGSIAPGETRDLPDAEAQELIAGRYAVPEGQDEADGVAPAHARAERPRTPKKSPAAAMKAAAAKKAAAKSTPATATQTPEAPGAGGA